MGEVEARNVQARAHYDWRASQIMHPSRTEGIPRHLQINPSDKSAAMSADIPGGFTPYSKRWPNNDNTRPRNEHERYIEGYDKIQAWVKSLPKNKWGIPKWNDLLIQKHKNMLDELDKVWDNP